MPKHMLDLFSGLGGASEAMLKAGWDVMRVENNVLLANVPNTYHTCIFDWWAEVKILLRAGHKIPKLDLIWASIPCTAFSQGYNAPRSIALREGIDYESTDGFKHAMTMVELVREIIDTLAPRYWIVENVVGSRHYFEPYFGKPTKYGPYLLYGIHPALHILPSDISGHKKDDSAWSSDPLRANKRSYIPLWLSNAVCQSIEAQKTLCYFD